MKAKIGVRQVMDRTGSLSKAVRKLTEQDVLVGIPADKTSREANESGEPDGVTNAFLGYIHEHGAPANNLPARPALIPGIKAVQADAAELLKGAAKSALEGNEGAVDAALNKIGLLAQNSVRARFVDNDWPPLSEATLNKRPHPGAKTRLERGAINPLIDSGQLRKAYTYVIRKRGGNLVVK